ncbi:MAG TPA: hypothetical protein VJ946_07640 [Bacteroidales bacterium]|nr:hypothetical protein [Bacteroidales bacterium]
MEPFSSPNPAGAGVREIPKNNPRILLALLSPVAVVGRFDDHFSAWVYRILMIGLMVIMDT